ncbi:MAG: sulfite oxidase [Desulfobacterales bacterium]|jgi:DMSO/TMAO reductase YedYZ molybdopterin-dependent catalytic subunit|nr:sulfite oxidase [Desulfobacterales bacterium]
MKMKMRVMNQEPFNAETPNQYLRSWITANRVFFARNQGQIPEKPIPLSDWSLTIEGEVNKPLVLDFDQICRMPKAIVSNTLECSGNSRSLFEKKASGNPWTIGGVGNAVWGGVWLRELLESAGPKANAHHVAFEGLDKPLGSAKIQFIRSIPIEKAMSSSLLAYEMNGEPLPLKHGYPLRALALGWTGANCVKWLHKIIVLDRPFEGFYMDKVYRKFQQGQDPKTGEVVTGINLKSIITQPDKSEILEAGRVTVLGAAYAGESSVERVEISVDDGKAWNPATFIGPNEPYAWRQWQFLWSVKEKGEYTLLSRATDVEGNQQPINANWNVLGYGNNGIREHAVTIQIS